jgi:hypothetical protein
MAISHGIKRDIQVSFQIGDISNAIEKISAESKNRYQIEDKNEVTNTYKMALVGGLMVVVPCTITLRKVSDSETQIVVESQKVTSSGNQANDIVDNFLKKLSVALTGEVVEVDNSQTKKGGCAGFVVSFAIAGAGVLYSIFG